MKKILCIVLLISFLSSLLFTADVFATGETVTVDGITYKSYGTYCAATGYDDSVSGKLYLPLSVDFGGTELPLTVIDDYAFSYNGSITEITVPASVDTIKEYAFFDCVKLRKVTLSAGVSSIDATAFYKCTKLKSIEVDSSNDHYASSDNVLYSKDMHTIIAYPPALTATEFTVPDGVTKIGDMAFSCCSNLTGITVPDGVTRIGYYAFAECSGIQTFDLPETVETIDVSAFECCTALSSMTIPNSVTIIDSDAFNYCENLTSVIIGSL